MAEERFNTIPASFQKFYEGHPLCRKWVESCALSLRNQRSVRDYAESLAQFLEFTNVVPPRLAKLGYDKALALMKKFVLWRVRTVGVSPKTVQRQWFAFVSFFKFCGVKGDYKFPSKNIPVTIKYLDKIPTKEELWRILQAPKLDLPTRISVHLIAYAGIRPDDMSKLTYDCVKRDLEKNVTPCSVYIPQGKTDNVYVTFIPGETAQLLKHYFDKRRRDGEKITDASPLILDHREFERSGKIKGVLRKNISRKITDAIRKSGIKTEGTFGRKTQRMRPYSLRKYFRSNLTSHASSEYIEAWLGHTSGLEHVYGGTRDLDPSTIERMRDAYKKCEPFLIATAQPLEQSAMIKEEFKRQLLLVAGFKQEEIEKMNLLDMGDDEFQETIRRKLAGLMEKNGARQKVVPLGKIEKYIGEGWEFHAALPNGKAIIKLPPNLVPGAE
jgi:integrase